jgi:5-hydroxyisourate hydrolase-like protein (transthyretin family)
MGMYPDQFPTRGGVAKAFNIEWRQAKGRPARGLMVTVKLAKKTEDSSESVQELTRQAGARMADQLRQAIAKRKARDQTNH